MAKLKDKFYNRVIEGELQAEEEIVASLVNKDVKVKTIEQSEANWSQDISITPTITNGEYTQIYAKFEIVNNILYYVFVYSLKAVGGNITQNNISHEVEFPSEIAEKIFDVLGKSVKEAGNNANIVGYEVGYRSNPAGAPQQVLRGGINNSNSANKLSFYHPYPAITEDTTMYIQERVFLTLI